MARRWRGTRLLGVRRVEDQAFECRHRQDGRGGESLALETAWPRSRRDDLTASPVWNCDFSSFRETGRYRLVVDGIGCSPEFVIGPDAYHEPFKTSVRGFFYMRMGMNTGYNPPPRQPRFIPNLDPPGFQVYRTTLEPGHPDWRAMKGDVWDLREEWAHSASSASRPTPTPGAGTPMRSTGIGTRGTSRSSGTCCFPTSSAPGNWMTTASTSLSGNGIPDLIDEARYEVDFWLRLRDGKGGYSFGLNNPNRDYRTMHQAGARPYMAWVNAANSPCSPTVCGSRARRR